MKYFQALLLIVIMSSCEKDEIPVVYTAPVLQQGTFITQIEMSSDYRYRTYYDLESDSVVARHRKRDWDLGFASAEGDSRIRLNSSKLMSVYRIDGVPFEDVAAVQGEGPLYDRADGTEAALDAWQSGDGVYVINRGYDAEVNDMGQVKIELLSMDAAGFTLRYAVLGSSEITEVTVPKDATVNMVMFSFDEGVQNLEPPKEDWDILFTHYTLFFDELFGQTNIQYLVAGALINPYLVEAQDLDLTDFDAIDATYIQSVELTSEEDVIGYDWKEFTLIGESYSILDNAFVIQTVEGNDYKFQFTNFLDENGERGAPTFQAALVD
jgi:hypothetical protein